MQLTNGDTVLIEEKTGTLKSVKAPSPREEKGRENHEVRWPAASGEWGER